MPENNKIPFYTHEEGVSLREHLQDAIKACHDLLLSKLISQQQLNDTQHAEMKQAVATALIAMNERLLGMNEFRASVQDITATLVTRQEVDAANQVLRGLFTRNAEQIEELKTFRAVMNSKASNSSVTVSMIISVIGLLIGVVSLVVKLRGG